MSIIDRLSTLVKSTANTAIDHLEDPTRTAEQLIRDFREDLAKAENELINVRASYNLQNTALKTAEDEAQKWEDRANNALDKNNDSLATQALQEKAKSMVKAQGLRPQVEALGKTYEALNARISKNKEKIDQLENRKDVLAAQQSTNTAIENTNKVLYNIGTGGNQLEAFNRLEEKVARSTARANAVEEIAADRNGSNLEAQFAELERSTTVNDELAALKAKRAAKP